MAYLINVKIDNIKCSAPFVSGCKYNIITDKLYKCLQGVKIFETDIELIRIGLNTIKPIGITQFTIEIDGESFTLEFFVVSSKCLNVEMILGLNLCQYAKITIDCSDIQIKKNKIDEKEHEDEVEEEEDNDVVGEEEQEEEADEVQYKHANYEHNDEEETERDNEKDELEEEEKKEDTATKEVDDEEVVDIATNENLELHEEQLQRSDYVTEQQQLRMDYELQLEQLHKALEQKQNIISSYQREHSILEEEKEEYEDEMDVLRERADRLEFENQKFKEELRKAIDQKQNMISLYQREHSILEKEKEEVTDQQQLRIDYELQLEQLRKEKEIERNEKESIVLKFANQKKLFIDAKKEKDVLEKQLKQAKRKIVDLKSKVVNDKVDEAVDNEDKEDNIENEDIENDDEDEKSEKTDVAATDKTTEEEIVDLVATTVGNTGPDDNELDEVEQEFVEGAEVLKEFAEGAEVLNRDSLEESKMDRRFKDSSIAVSDYVELRHKFREKGNAVQQN